MLRVITSQLFYCHIISITLFLITVGSHTAVAEDCKGCVALDSISFNKVVPKFKAALVKFDVAFPYGEKQEEYAKVALSTKGVNDLLIAEVGVKDYGNKDNADLAKRFYIDKEDYPALLLFVHGKSEPYKFSAEKDTDFNANNIKRFIKSKSTVYLGLPGCVEQLDKLAEEFRNSKGNEREGILKKAKLFEKTLPEEHQNAAKIYVKTMEKVLEKGDVFVQTEHTRIDGLLKGKLSKEKKNYMQERKNILQSFVQRDEL